MRKRDRESAREIERQLKIRRKIQSHPNTHETLEKRMRSKTCVCGCVYVYKNRCVICLAFYVSNF